MNFKITFILISQIIFYQLHLGLNCLRQKKRTEKYFEKLLQFNFLSLVLKEQKDINLWNQKSWNLAFQTCPDLQTLAQNSI